MNDLKFAFRQLLKNPGFTAVAVLTLALGIGANTAIFSVVNAVLFRPLPFREPGRLVWIANVGEGGMSAVTTTVGNFKDWRAMNQSFDGLAGYNPFFEYGGYNLTGAGEPERLRGVGVSQNFLEVLGIQPMLGRNFVEEECQAVSPRAVLLSHGFWTRRFAADPGIVGRALTLNNQPAIVVGVLPASFDFASIFAPGTRVDFLLPFPLSAETERWGNTLAVIGRARPGVTLEKAQAEFDLINRQIRQSHPERWAFGAKFKSLPDQISARFRRPFLVLFGAVGCVLLIACANLSNLLLARAAGRRKEIAVRIALGARGWQIIRQLLTESLFLAGCGAAVGLPLAFALTKTLASSRAFSVPLLSSVSVDGRALLFTLLVACATGLLFGIAPALQLSGGDVHERLQEAARGSSGGSRRTWIREALVVSEVALACVLLVGAGLLLRSFIRLLDVDPGFRPEQAVAWRLEINRQFPDATARNIFYQQLVQRIEAVPGVESAGLTDTLPLGRNRQWGVRAKGETYAKDRWPTAFPRIIDPGYIKTMGIPLRAGRGFTALDSPETEGVLLINETMARQLWPGKEAVGQVALRGDYEFRVVGVVGNVRHGALDQEASSEMYYLGCQIGWGATELVVRTKMTVASLVPGVRAALREIDPQLPTTDFQTLGHLVDQAVSPRRLIAQLLGAFSILALGLAAVGIYGVISYSVSQRTQEMGIRLALGSPAAAVLNLVMGEGMKLAVIGVVIGLLASLSLTRVIQALLFGVSATDPITLGANALLLTLVALFSCWLPARRAARIEPMVALRME